MNNLIHSALIWRSLQNYKIINDKINSIFLLINISTDKAFQKFPDINFSLIQKFEK